jgi:hypothetical protein
MCAGCAMAAASAATGFRSWLQTHSYGWLTPQRLRRLTIAAMCAAGLVSTVGISGSSASAKSASGQHGGPTAGAAHADYRGERGLHP